MNNQKETVLEDEIKNEKYYFNNKNIKIKGYSYPIYVPGEEGISVVNSCFFGDNKVLFITNNLTFDKVDFITSCETILTLSILKLKNVNEKVANNIKCNRLILENTSLDSLPDIGNLEIKKKQIVIFGSINIQKHFNFLNEFITTIIPDKGFYCPDHIEIDNSPIIYWSDNIKKDAKIKEWLDYNEIELDDNYYIVNKKDRVAFDLRFRE